MDNDIAARIQFLFRLVIYDDSLWSTFINSPPYIKVLNFDTMFTTIRLFRSRIKTQFTQFGTFALVEQRAVTGENGLFDARG